MSTVPVIDHSALAQSRVLSQFSESTNFLAFIDGLMQLTNDIEACLQSMQSLADIDGMEGVQLDVIGIIVGTSRNVSGVVTLTWFGFADTGTYATTFGEEGNPGVGSRFYEEGEALSSTTILQDPEFRLLIKTKIVKNNSACTPEDIIQGLRFIFGVEDIKLTEGNCTLAIAIGRPVYSYEQAMISALDILPRPAGISITGAVTSYTAPGTGYTGGTEGEDY